MAKSVSAAKPRLDLLWQVPIVAPTRWALAGFKKICFMRQQKAGKCCRNNDYSNCGEVLRHIDDAQRLRAVLASVIEHLPDDYPMVAEAKNLL